MVDSTVNKSMTLQPEYIENFIKDLLSNIYSVDPETGEATGIGAESPLYGKPVTDADGNPVYDQQAVLDADGNEMLDEFGNPLMENSLDQSGNPIQSTIGGVAPPDVIGFTDAQQRALEMMGGQYDADGNYIEGSAGTGKADPYFDKSQEMMDLGLGAYQSAMDMADPGAYKQFMNPYTEEVIDSTQADILKAGQEERARIGSQMVNAGAFGGSRGAIVDQELSRNVGSQMAKTGGELRAGAFENAVKMGQNASTLFGNLGAGIGSLATQQGALGESAQGSFLKDVNSLFNTGTLEQQQLQNEYDVDRAAQIEEAYEPFSRFGFMRDIVSGVPSGVTSSAATYTPNLNPVANTFSLGSNIYNNPGLGNTINKNGLG
jgi:hypothetical protein